MRLAFFSPEILTPVVGENAKRLEAYLKHLRTVNQTAGYPLAESAINLPFDADILRTAGDLISQTANAALKYVLLIGIGGSSLGAQAIYDALVPPKVEGLSPRQPRLLIADTLDPVFAGELLAWLKTKVNAPEEILIIVVSKSGATLETVANSEAILSVLVERFGPAAWSRVIAVTDQGSPLWAAAQEKQAGVLTIPTKVSGRFSVFSAVGLAPLAALGLPVAELLDGAKEMTKQCLEADAAANPALAAAALIDHYYRSGKTNLEFFLFAPALKSLGEWTRQLYAESLGKERDLDNQAVTVGLTPVVSIGTNDLHSVLQLNLAGPADKMTLAVTAGSWLGDETLPPEGQLNRLGPLAGKTFGQMLDAIAVSVAKAYQDKGRPWWVAEWDSISARELGAFMQWQMITVMNLAYLWRVNAFDQPQVESYKKTARELLG